MDSPAPDESASIIGRDALELKNVAEYGTRGEPDGSETEPESMDSDAEYMRHDAEGEESSGSEGLEGGEGKKEKKKKRMREVWDNKVQFILTLIGYAVGLGNVWRFSYLSAKNGGSAFIFPYLIMLFLVGIPLFYLELLLGQSTRKGPVGAWFKLIPNLWGIGLAAVVVIVYICLYYNVIIGWVIFYFVNSFHSPLPWAQCFGFGVPGNANESAELLAMNLSDPVALETCWNASTQYYWYNTAVQASGSIGAAETFNWQMFLSLGAAWVLVYLCLFRGIESSGKIVYFTATFPYLVLVCLFFRAVTLPGAGQGVKYLFYPDPDIMREKIVSPQVWLEAATQIFFSLGVATGALIALSSYSKRKYNALQDSFIVCITNSATSIFSAIVVFAIVGFRAERTGADIKDITDRSGPGLAFVLFTEALIHMPGAPFWAVMFFIMLLLLGLDSQFGTLEAFITVLRDIKSIGKIRKEIVVGVVCFGMFIISTPFILGNGVYLFQLFDQFSATLPLLIIGFFEFVAIGWVFGVERFFTEVCNKTPSRNALRFWTAIWMFVNPIIMFIIFFGSLISGLISPLEYDRYHNLEEETIDYPSWALFIGAVIVLSSQLVIPVVLIGRLILFEEARQQARDFLQAKVSQFENFYHRLKSCFRSCRRGCNREGARGCWRGFCLRCSPSGIKDCFRSCRVKCSRSWKPQIDEDGEAPYGLSEGTIRPSNGETNYGTHRKELEAVEDDKKQD